MPGGIEYACQGRFMIPKIILTSPLAAGVRTLTRHAGLNRLVSQLMRNRGYEERFGSELLKWVAAGDCVWDVGANVGFYTMRFAEKVGQGAVVAFEPAESCIGSGRWDGAHAARRRSSVDDQSPEDKR